MEAVTRLCCETRTVVIEGKDGGERFRVGPHIVRTHREVLTISSERLTLGKLSLRFSAAIEQKKTAPGYIAESLAWVNKRSRGEL